MEFVIQRPSSTPSVSPAAIARRLVARLGRSCRRWLPLLGLVASVVACSSDEAGGTTLPPHIASGAAPADARPEPPAIVTPPGAYRATSVLSDGLVSGTVRIAGEIPEDTLVRPTMDQGVCGTSFTDRTMVHRGTLLADAVVWITDLRSGRALPLRRRFEVMNVHCRLEPRVQAVVTGGTLNVRTKDPLVHRTRILRQGTESTLAVIRQNDAGEVVPVHDALTGPGMLELRSDVHPWTRAFVAVFDHPYFDVTGADGAFTITGLPPGQYTIAAWHERLGRIEHPVTITAGERATVELTFGAPTPAADSVRAPR